MASEVEKPPLNPPTEAKNYNNAAHPESPERAHLHRPNPDLHNVKKD